MLGSGPRGTSPFCKYVLFINFNTFVIKCHGRTCNLISLCVLQYLYWEKVQPIIGPKYDPLALLSPLMRNWTEDMAVRRDKYDYEYGRGVGMVILVIMFFYIYERKLSVRMVCMYNSLVAFVDR